MQPQQQAQQQQSRNMATPVAAPNSLSRILQSTLAVKEYPATDSAALVPQASEGTQTVP